MLELILGFVADRAMTYFKILQSGVRCHQRAILAIAGPLAETLHLFGETIKTLFDNTSAAPVVGKWGLK